MEAWNGFSLNAYMEEEEENGLEHGAPVAPPARSNHKQHNGNSSNQQSRTLAATKIRSGTIPSPRPYCVHALQWILHVATLWQMDNERDDVGPGAEQV
mmetsp:Transcript_6657/g.11812  ORF Transcript_6657/g.11812 Transcript_6657/m.11812 type:complete len:98 (+) Transcript_6657:779-1072(+)